MDNNKVVKRTAAGVVTSLFVISNILPTVVQAASIASNKEEVVYVNLNSDGDLLGTYVVNIFNDSDITDYGNYIEVRNMILRISYIMKVLWKMQKYHGI